MTAVWLIIKTDTPRTERLDYFSAATTILFALYFTAIRLFHLYLPSIPAKLTQASPSNSSGNRVRTMWNATCALALFLHISYLSLLPRFDYTYNIIFNLAVGLVHNLLWTIYSLPASLSLIQRFPYQSRTYRPSFVTQAGILVIFTTAATGLELFDFPAWGRVIDAHSLWHLATAPLAIYWYRFLVEDAQDPSWRDRKILS
jgi:post-GPI attachment to proteins factor 3